MLILQGDVIFMESLRNNYALSVTLSLRNINDYAPVGAAGICLRLQNTEEY